MSLYIGIDPGKSGGIASIYCFDDGGRAVKVINMPEDDGELFRRLSGMSKWSGQQVFVMLERAHAMPRKVRKGGIANFKMGESYGRIKMALAAARIQFEEVAAIRWQNVMQCRTGGDKRVTRTKAMAMFSGIRVTHATADALLIAEYCRRLRLGIIPASTKPSRR